MFDIPKVDISQISIPDPINPKTNWGYQGINRIVIIGNGFDLAHGLKTKYENFYEWYWEQRFMGLKNTYEKVSNDGLCSFKISLCDMGFSTYIYQKGLKTEKDWRHIKVKIEADEAFISRKDTLFFSNICKKIETKGWVDIENEYYNLLKKHVIAEISMEERDRRIEELNNQLTILKEKLIEYLSTIQIDKEIVIEELEKKIYAPIEKREIAVDRLSTYYDHIQKWANADEESWECRYAMYGDACYALKHHTINFAKGCVGLDNQDIDERISHTTNLKVPILWPDNILFLNFNYTPLGDLYTRIIDGISNVHIHGEISDSKHVIFGYGDEIDELYPKLMNYNNNRYLDNLKTFQYNETDNYRMMLEFIESAPFQIYIMGHSCGNSDRTLLNTLFEHKNCVSIKPFYHKFEDGLDNYRDLEMNISRNFRDMKLTRFLIVNKTYCETI